MSWDPLTLPVDPPLHSISTHVWSRTHNLASNKNIVCVCGEGGGEERKGGEGLNRTLSVSYSINLN